MAKVYRCRMVETCEFSIRADSEEDALFYAQTHSVNDIRAETTMFDMTYDEEVVGESYEDYAPIDISTGEQEEMNGV